jgi:hypothetical protein
MAGHQVLFTADLSAFKEPKMTKATTTTTSVKSKKRKVVIVVKEEEGLDNEEMVVKEERKSRGLRRVKVEEEIVTKKVKVEVKREEEGGVELYSLAERVKGRIRKRP